MNSLGNMTAIQEYTHRLHSNDASLYALEFENENIGDDDAIALAQALRVNTFLTVFGLKENKIGDVGATALAQALQVNKFLKVFILDGNNIGDNGAIALAQALQVNTTLTVIGLEKNNIGDVGATALAQVLQVNTTLTKIGLTNNNIGDVGATALARALQVNTTELFVEALQSIVLQLEATLQFMSDFSLLSSFYTKVSANYKVSVIDVNERNRLRVVYQALKIAQTVVHFCTILCGIRSCSG
jgi:Ran GTPase-activating protein (RanGAP) involved in mRNA processing and transport